MNSKQSLKTLSLAVSIVLIIGALSGCAAKKPVWGDTRTGLILAYRMSADTPLKYSQSASQVQNMEVMGSTVKVTTSKEIGFSAQPGSLDGSNHTLGITIDSMTLSIESPQGNLSPDLGEIPGRSFDLVLSPLGKEIDLSGAESIEYDLGPSGKRNLSTDFQSFFPDLADRPVRIGDSWTTNDTITEKSERGEVRIEIENVNKLNGYETIDGMECARIVADVTGTITGNGNEGGMEMTFDGKMSGTATWYFAFQEGLFVKNTTEIHSDSTITISGPQNMTIPSSQELTFESRLLGTD